VNTAAAERLERRSPFDGSRVADMACDNAAAITEKIEAARAAQREWRRLPLERRIQAIGAALEYFRGQNETIARDTSRQMGKPIQEARGEVQTLLARAEHMLAIAPAALATEHPPGRAGFELAIEHVPVGLVLDIAAWNYPLIVPINVVVPALAAGNAVLLKHSPLVPLCGAHFERAFASLGPGLFANLVVPDTRAGELVADERIDFVSFTGSVPTGRKVYEGAAHRLAGVGLELGGKDPAYVAEDADLDFAAPNLVEGACYNAGQSCCAVERAYVHERHYERFLERALAGMRTLVPGDPLDERTTLGPLARREALDLLERQVRDALARGARLLCGGQRMPGTGLFFPPTLLADVPNEAEVMQEESFGPILPVARVANDAEALAKMNDSRFGLSASVWTRSSARADWFARELEAGTVFQNRCDFLDPALAWTGLKQSGLGETLSRHGFHAFTRRKSLHLRR
jgi:acyl-CoA reductase-like NAD-dependent aldehyde dehydrogenase